MAKKSSMTFVEDFAFYEQLWNYYISNRGKIRSRYNDLTKKFLAYNDRNENPDAFLRTPQFEALEMYVFIKEFMNNAHMFQMFDDWRNHRDKFSDVSYYTIHKRGQITLLDLGDEQNEAIFKQMKKYRESYPMVFYRMRVRCPQKLQSFMLRQNLKNTVSSRIDCLCLILISICWN